MSKHPLTPHKKRINIKAYYELVGKNVTATLTNPFGDGDDRQYEANEPPLRTRESLYGQWIETDQTVNVYVHSTAPILFDLREYLCHIHIRCTEIPVPPIGNFLLPNRYFSIVSDIVGHGRHEYTNGVISIVSLTPGAFQFGFELQRDSDGKGVDISNGRFYIEFSA